MEFLSTSPSTTADDSSCDDSTGPTTPESISPLLGAAHVEDLETPLAQYMINTKPPVNALATKQLPFHAAPGQREALFSKPVRHIAVVGAGYVGKQSPFRRMSSDEQQCLIDLSLW
jgi:UDPglucose 6-dehydrogenase